MAKPQKPRPDTNRKADREVRPAAPARLNARLEAESIVAAAPKAPGSLGTLSGPGVKYPGAKISRRAADRLRGGHLWVYASDIESFELPVAGEPPALLPVADSRGILLGTALYSPSSQIALRLVSREAIDEAEWLELLA